MEIAGPEVKTFYHMHEYDKNDKCSCGQKLILNLSQSLATGLVTKYGQIIYFKLEG